MTPQYGGYGGYGPPPPKPYEHLNPLLIVGILLFVLAWFPFINFPKWLMYLGIVFIIIGAFLSIAKIIMGDEKW